jgi:ATP-grasp domain, R2K clade family 3
MASPSWLIQADVFGRSSDPVRAALRRRGLGGAVVQPRSFLLGVSPDVAGRRLGPGDCVVFWGTYPLMRHIQIHHRWVPGGWCSADEFECDRYYPAFGQRLLNHESVTLGLDEALGRADEVFARFASSGRVFIRPGGLEKVFTGRCVDRAGFDAALTSARYAHGRVLVARPRPVGAEWRLVVARGAFVAASRYRTDGRSDVSPGCPAEVRAFGEQALAGAGWQPDPIFMLDVCESGGSLWVLELNSFSCSGVYACDADAVVETASQLAAEAWERAQAAS